MQVNPTTMTGPADIAAGCHHQVIEAGTASERAAALGAALKNKLLLTLAALLVCAGGARGAIWQNDGSAR